MLKDRIPDSQQYEIGGILAVRVRSVADKAYLRGATTLVTPESKVEKCNDLGIIFQE